MDAPKRSQNSTPQTTRNRGGIWLFFRHETKGLNYSLWRNFFFEDSVKESFFQPRLGLRFWGFNFIHKKSLCCCLSEYAFFVFKFHAQCDATCVTDCRLILLYLWILYIRKHKKNNHKRFWVSIRRSEQEMSAWYGV